MSRGAHCKWRGFKTETVVICREEKKTGGDIGLLGLIDCRGLTLSQVKRQKHSYEDCSDSKIPGFF